MDMNLQMEELKDTALHLAYVPTSLCYAPDLPLRVWVHWSRRCWDAGTGLPG